VRVIDDVSLTKYEDLEEGQCFKWSKDAENVLLKTDYEQDAVDLVDGEYYSDLCGEDVYPVEAEIHIIN
jgi:hypothetical protein